MNAIGYARCSTQEQADSGLGIEAQKQRIEAYAAMRGLRLVDVILDEGVSGGLPLIQRPGGKRILSLSTGRNGEIDSVVTLRLDRAFRNATDCLTTVEKWDDAGVALHFVDLGGNAIDTQSAAGRFMLVVLAAAAEMERNLTRERTRAAMAAKKRRGESCGNVNYGYRLGPDGRTEVEDPVEQLVIERIIGLWNEGYGPPSICYELDRTGARCRGKNWQHTTVRRILQRAGLYSAKRGLRQRKRFRR